MIPRTSRIECTAAPNLCRFAPDGMERPEGIEPSSSVWKTVALPLSYSRLEPSAGFEPATRCLQNSRSTH